MVWSFGVRYFLIFYESQLDNIILPDQSDRGIQELGLTQVIETLL